MLIPTKHEKLENNILVLGSDILTFLKIKNYNIEDLFQKIKKIKPINLDQYYNTLTFLWLAKIINLTEHRIFIKK